MRVTDIGAVKSSLKRLFTRGEVHPVVVPIDYLEKSRPLVDELQERLPVARNG